MTDFLPVNKLVATSASGKTNPNSNDILMAPENNHHSQSDLMAAYLSSFITNHTHLNHLHSLPHQYQSMGANHYSPPGTTNELVQFSMKLPSPPPTLRLPAIPAKLTNQYNHSVKMLNANSHQSTKSHQEQQFFPKLMKGLPENLEIYSNTSVANGDNIDLLNKSGANAIGRKHLFGISASSNLTPSTTFGPYGARIAKSRHQLSNSEQCFKVSGNNFPFILYTHYTPRHLSISNRKRQKKSI